MRPEGRVPEKASQFLMQIGVAPRRSGALFHAFPRAARFPTPRPITLASLVEPRNTEDGFPHGGEREHRSA